MSRTTIWSVLVFAVFAFATVIIFFWVRDGSLSKAGVSMDKFMKDAGSTVAQTTGDAVKNTGEAIHDATDNDDKT